MKTETVIILCCTVLSTVLTVAWRRRGDRIGSWRDFKESPKVWLRRLLTGLPITQAELNRMRCRPLEAIEDDPLLQELLAQQPDHGYARTRLRQLRWIRQEEATQQPADTPGTKSKHSNVVDDEPIIRKASRR